MSKLFFQCLLLSSIASVASAAVPAGTLLGVSYSSPSTPSDHYSATCIIKPLSVVISHTTTLFPSGVTFKAVETKNVAVSAATLNSLITKAALGVVNNPMIVGGGTHRYSAYQPQANSVLKEIVLGDTLTNITNTAPEVQPLMRFIDSVCGDITK